MSSQSDYLNSLRRHLSALPESDRDEIIRDQEEYFRDALASGRSEAEVIRSLGEPKSFAASIILSQRIQRVEESTNLPAQVSQTAGAVFAVLALAPFNLIFVLGPYAALVGLLIAGWAVALSALFAVSVVSWSFFWEAFGLGVGALVHLSSVFLSLGLAGLSILGLLSMYKITHWFVQGTLRYLKWNLRLIHKRA